MSSKITVEKADAKMVLLPKEAIKADQDNIRKNVLSIDKSVHDNAVQCLMHAKEHGDTSLMRRLLIEVLGVRTTQTGYRTQGLINWMRKHSPMELKGDVINLSGVLDAQGISALRKQYPELKDMELVAGAKRPFLIEQANRTHFTKDADNAEKVGKPIFQATLLSPVHRAIKDMMEAAENTVKVDGKPSPIDPKKAYYDGVEMDNVVSIFASVRDQLAKLPKDSTLEVRKAQAERRRLDDFISANPVPSETEGDANGRKTA